MPAAEVSDLMNHASGASALQVADEFCVCYVLSYRAPEYIRTTTLLRALVHCKGIRIVGARNRRRGGVRYIETFFRLLRTRFRERPDAYIIGFRGHEIFWLVRILGMGRPLILDALMSPYAALKEENKSGRIGRWLAPLVFRLESAILRRADVVLTDTRLHAEYYVRTFGLPPSKVLCVPVGAIDPEPDDLSVQQSASPGEFSALFYGSFLALHGIDVIIEAAAHLTDLPIRFDFIGGGPDQQRQLRQKCEALGVDRFTHRRWVPFNQLLAEDIPRADLCLGGPFGGTPQGRRVVTGKTIQGLALGKPTVIGRIEEDYGFEDRVNCLLVKQGDAADLAGAIRWAYEHRQLLPAVGRRGRALYEATFSDHIIAGCLDRALSLVRADATTR